MEKINLFKIISTILFPLMLGGCSFDFSDKWTFKVDPINETECSVILYGNTVPNEIVVPSTIGQYTVVKILSFRNRTNLEKVVLPNTIRELGSESFYGCSALSDINLPENLNTIGDDAFYQCNSLTEIKIPDSVTYIGNRAFSMCKSLENICMPNNDFLETGVGIFSFCNNLKYTTYLDAEYLGNSNNPYYALAEYNKNSEELAINSNCKIILGGAMQGAHKLTSIEIPDSVTCIGDAAFYGIETFTNVILSENLRKIGASSFKQTLIKDITIPNSVLDIGDKAFSDCKELSNVKLSENLKTIGSGSFANCNLLTEINIPDSIENLYNDSFENCNNLTYNEHNDIFYLGNSTNRHLVAMEAINEYIYTCATHNECKVIATEAFRRNSFQSVILNEGLEFIGGAAFRTSKGITDLIIPPTVTRIGDNAFFHCENLSYIILPISVKEIGGHFCAIAPVTIYTEHSSKPSGWNYLWNEDNKPVYWQGQWEYDSNGIPTPIN